MRIRSVVIIILAISSAFVFLAPTMVAYPGGPLPGSYDYGCGGSCHDDESSATITMWTPLRLIEPHDLINVTVNVTGAEADGTPLGVMILSALGGENSSLASQGWTIIKDPGGITSYNYYQVASYAGSVSMTWTLMAPVANCTVSLYAREMHGDGGSYVTDYAQGLTFTVLENSRDPSTLAPHISITSHLSGQTAEGIDELAATIQSYDDVEYVILRIDGVMVSNLSDEPFEWSIDTTLYSDGSHELNITAIDIAGRVGWTDIQVIFDNDKEMTSWVLTIIAISAAAIALCVATIAMMGIMHGKTDEGDD